MIIGGALWTAWRLCATTSPRRAVARAASARPGVWSLGNVLIAAGTIVLSASGTFAGRLGKDRAFAVTLLVGIVVLFAGFLVASHSTARPPRHAELTPARGGPACRSTLRGSSSTNSIFDGHL